MNIDELLKQEPSKKTLKQIEKFLGETIPTKSEMLELIIKKLQAELDSKDKEIRELKEVLYDVITQFGFHNSSKGYYYTGGLSTIENIFCILGYEDIVKDSEIKEYFENLTKEKK